MLAGDLRKRVTVQVFWRSMRSVGQVLTVATRNRPRTLQNFVTITNNSVHLGNLLSGSTKKHCTARCTRLLTQVVSGAKIALRLLTPHVLRGV